MKERPILFKGDMVRAILEGRKTQTRRVMKVPPPNDDCGISQLVETTGDKKDLWKFSWFDKKTMERVSSFFKQPYGFIGDRLWVRETFLDGWPCVEETGEVDCFDEKGCEKPKHVWYRADDPKDGHHYISQLGAPIGVWLDDNGNFKDNLPWKPSIHMPRWASRITLEITNVKIERLNDISPDDIIAEGAWKPEWSVDEDFSQCYEAFQELWDSTTKDHKWGANPWVWVIEFKRIEV